MSRGQYGKGCADTKKDLYPVIRELTKERNFALIIIVILWGILSLLGVRKLIEYLKKRKGKRH